MPSDPLINLTTSGAAAFCARVCIHPLDHVKASTLDPSKPIRARLLDHLKHLDHYLHSTTPHRHTLARYRGLFQGVSFALLIQVPALAFFLSTYDATKHTLAHIAHALYLPFFHLHHAETHLASGAMAKVAGTVLWAPQQLLQGMHKGQGQLSIRDAVLLAKKVCREQGVKALWTGYQRSLIVLLPYTAVYFATYEKLKHLARRHLLEEEVRFDPIDGKRDQEDLLHPTALRGFGSKINEGTSAGRVSVFQNSREYSLQLMETTPTPLNLGTYMICVAGAVAISATELCGAAEKFDSPGIYRSDISIITNTGNNPYYPIHVGADNADYYHGGSDPSRLNSSTAPSMKQQQIATTTLSPASFGTAKNTKRVARNQGGFLRSLTRGLGPRIMWTAPGVTLTTAGFEVFRNMALGVV
ncbi:hypothetical protein BGZ93_005134 [Podila epicladia]|nr:hypothetical protein BGZ92_007438 [Podila epicladia]KAG0095999.1 hypothetical protein BGZ93_005134 [Podila epicladia]